MATTSDSQGTHDWHAAAYVDRWIADDVTDDQARRPQLRRLAGWLPEGTRRVLDVGSGYGLLADAVLEVRPGATVVVHDFSEPMLGHAKRRLERFDDRVAYASSDLRDPRWVDSVGGPFDAVVSAIAIHNVRDVEIIRRIYAQINRIVSPGGCFFTMDFVARATSGTPGDPDRPTLYNQLRWLAAAGFDEVDCLLRDGRQALLAGYRLADPVGPGRR